MKPNPKPDLTFRREFGITSEGLEFYLSEDGFLEIGGWNCDDDSFTIILDPLEIGQLKDLLKRTE